jgi:hypothetical protein
MTRNCQPEQLINTHSPNYTDKIKGPFVSLLTKVLYNRPSPMHQERASV